MDTILPSHEYDFSAIRSSEQMAALYYEIGRSNDEVRGLVLKLRKGYYKFGSPTAPSVKKPLLDRKRSRRGFRKYDIIVEPILLSIRSILNLLNNNTEQKIIVKDNHVVASFSKALGPLAEHIDREGLNLVPRMIASLLLVDGYPYLPWLKLPNEQRKLFEFLLLREETGDFLTITSKPFANKSTWVTPFYKEFPDEKPQWVDFDTIKQSLLRARDEYQMDIEAFILKIDWGHSESDIVQSVTNHVRNLYRIHMDQIGKKSLATSEVIQRSYWRSLALPMQYNYLLYRLGIWRLIKACGQLSPVALALTDQQMFDSFHQLEKGELRKISYTDIKEDVLQVIHGLVSKLNPKKSKRKVKSLNAVSNNPQKREAVSEYSWSTFRDQAVATDLPIIHWLVLNAYNLPKGVNTATHCLNLDGYADLDVQK